MKITTKGRYGVRLMIELALCFDKGPATLKDIAGRLDVSEKYLGHLIPPLKNARLIDSARGSCGGYFLSRHPRSINLLQVVSAVEGPICLVECARKPSVCKRTATCISREIWVDVTRKVRETLSSATLEKMLKGKKKK